MTTTFRAIYLALLVAQSLVLFLFEGLIPLPFLPPGAKLGLANIVTVVALYTLPRARDAFLVLALRTVLAAMLGGGPTVFLYSMGGGAMSFFAMALLKGSRRFSVLGVSAAGGFFHHVGQLVVATIAVGNPGLWLYLPALGPCGILTGALIGIAAHRLLLRLPEKFIPRDE